MDIGMGLNNSGGSDSPDSSSNSGKKGGKKPVHRSGIKSKKHGEEKPQADNSGRASRGGFHGHNHRQHKNQQKYKNQNGSNSSALGYDLDFSIQEELNSGNYKFRGGKAQVSINHLLQFQLPEIERDRLGDSRELARRRNKSDNAIHLTGDSFINANYRLLVDDRFEYKEQGNHPDVPIPQENIVRVIVPRGQKCPICLEEPVAPQMVACGHIFCYSCLINFFSIEEVTRDTTNEYSRRRKLKECPLCGNIIRQNKIKSVIFEEDIPNEAPQPNSRIKLSLMCKPHDSILPLPVELEIDPSRTGNFPPAEFDSLSKYAHIMKCNPEKTIEMLRKDIDDINTQYEIDRILYSDNGKFYKLAVKELESRIKSISEQQVSQPDIARSLSNVNLGCNLREKYNDNSAFFFYQTAFQSSTKFFLSPLDVKILLNAYHQYCCFPEELSMVAENIHYGTSVTEDLLSRYKYFGHLPLGTEIAFIDLDWRDNMIIPKAVEQQFIGELKKRRKKLHLKKQKEDKEKAMYQMKIEKEHEEFYRRENGDNPLVPEFMEYGNHQISLEALSPKQREATTNEGSGLKKGYVERTIWGTSISLQQDKQTSQENQEFEAMLLQRMQESESSNSRSSGQKGKKNKKNKGKVMLLSNTHQTY